MKKSFDSIIFIALALMFVSCGGSDATPKDLMDIYGVKFNPEREKIGLKTLPESFVVGEFVPGWIISWSDFDSLCTRPKAYYTQKTIYFKGDTLMKEMDEFRLIVYPFPAYQKTLGILRYYYAYRPQDGFDSTRWIYTYVINEFPNEWDGVLRHEDHTGNQYSDMMIRGDKKDDPRIPFTREEADSILASWGLTYPN